MNPKKKFTHYILCRYNTGLYSKNPYKIENPNYWMNRRISHFSNLLLSLESQTNKNFKFIVFLDKKTPEEFVKQISSKMSEILKNVNYEIVYDSVTDFLKKLKIPTEFFISSRIDNDDEYFPEFVDSIQNSFSENEEVIDVVGCQYDVINKKKYTSGRTIPNSPFISLVEKSDSIKSAFYTTHSNMHTKFKSKFVQNKNYLYKQNIHKENISNKIIGKLID